MRKRLGAFHADSIEQFIQSTQQTQELQKKNTKYSQFENIDNETNTSTKAEEIDQKEYCNINILIIDNCNQIDQIFQYCNTPRMIRSNYHLEYCSKIESTNSKENHFHFWILNQESPKYQELINVYFTIIETYIYLYHKSFESKYQQFIEKIQSLSNIQNKVIYKIVDTKRISSMNNFQDKKQVTQITLQNLHDVIKRVKDQYF